MHVKRYQNYLEILFFMATSLFGSFPKTSKIPFYTLENPPAGRQQRAVPKKWVTFSADPRLTSKKRLYIIFMKAYVWHLFFCGITAQTVHKAAQKNKPNKKWRLGSLATVLLSSHLYSFFSEKMTTLSHYTMFSIRIIYQREFNHLYGAGRLRVAEYFCF